MKATRVLYVLVCLLILAIAAVGQSTVDTSNETPPEIKEFYNKQFRELYLSYDWCDDWSRRTSAVYTLKKKT